MGYNLTIGNGEPSFSKDYGELSARWEVEIVEHTTAPDFADDPTGQTNMRSPSYSAWSGFCDAVGLRALFYGDQSDDGWLTRHPGCALIEREHVEQIAGALKTYRAKWPGLTPGFSEAQNPTADSLAASYLARLIWLDYWVRWAFASCETPAIENS